MRLVITGGGTGGHVFPALEVARLARDRGHELLYLGSLRGQEKAACEAESIRFEGFASEPLYSLRSMRGIRAGFRLIRATGLAKKALKRWEPDVVFSTGGYSAAPVVAAARSLNIPYVLLEANSVPGRSNAMFAKQAFATATVFKTSEKHFPGANVVRTGMPIRKALRDAAANRNPGKGLSVLITGGSQGSEFLNKHLPAAAAAMKDADLSWLHVAGKGHAVEVSALAKELALGERYEVKEFLDAQSMADAYGSATLIVARSGGSLAELALFGLPSVLVPLPTSAGNHQLHNAQEFVDMGAARLHVQAGSTPATLAADIQFWIDDPARRSKAAQALKSFDIPDSTERIVALIEEAAK